MASLGWIGGASGKCMNSSKIKSKENWDQNQRRVELKGKLKELQLKLLQDTCQMTRRQWCYDMIEKDSWISSSDFCPNRKISECLCKTQKVWK